MDSPCIDLCTLNDKGEYCIGCMRTIQEITGWSQMTDAERKAVMAKLKERRAKWRPASFG